MNFRINCRFEEEFNYCAVTAASARDSVISYLRDYGWQDGMDALLTMIKMELFGYFRVTK